jgi:hypothetical protein
MKRFLLQEPGAAWTKGSLARVYYNSISYTYTAYFSSFLTLPDSCRDTARAHAPVKEDLIGYNCPVFKRVIKPILYQQNRGKNWPKFFLKALRTFKKMLF